MKNRLLPLFGLAFVAAGANAQSWTAPVATGVAPEEVDTVYMLNVDAGMFMLGANAWGTQTSIGANGLPFVIKYDAENAGYTIMTAGGTKAGKYVFRDNNEQNFIDMGTQGHQYWAIRKQESGYYRIQSAEGDATFGNAETALGEAYAVNFMGWSGDPASTVILSNVEPDYTNEETGFKTGVDWQFVTAEEYVIYKAKKALYDQLVASEEFSSVDASAYAAIYTNASATVEEIEGAAEELKEKVSAARAYAVLEGASEDNPKDATSLLVNPNFNGNIDGWTCSFESGKTASNVGYQGASYTNGDVTINGFIEAWANSSFSTAISSRAIGDAELSQTMKSLPAGKYKLTCDCIAVNQDGQTPLYGVELFATGGEIDKYENLSTGNNQPEHFELEFLSSGGDVTLGLRTRTTNANWIAADNFTLTYFGATEEDPFKVALDEAVEKYEEKYDLDDVAANATIKEKYSKALEDAKSESEDYSAAKSALDEAAAALQTSINEYITASKSIEDIQTKIGLAEEREWGALADNLSDYLDELQDKYDAGTLDSEEIAGIQGAVNTYIGEYISENAQAGDDVTILLNNPGFDTDFSGWDVDEDKAKPAWGGMNLENTSGTGAQLADLQSGNAEVYHAAFDISQTIQKMPRGMYTLTCQAFERDDNGAGVEAELYAVVNGKEQSVKIKNLYDETSEEVLYQNGESTWDTSKEYNGGYVPNTMCGANVYFAAGYYKNKFSIIVTEQADIKVGIRTKSTGDWVLFDDFKLVYEGSGAGAYASTIQDLIEKAGATSDKGGMTGEADSKISDAITAGENAMSGGTTDECVEAINGLNDAIAFAEQSIKNISSLQYLYDLTTGYRMDEIESSDEALGNLVDEIGAALENNEFETEAQVTGYVVALKSGFTKYAQADHMDATEEEPADLTPVILTPNSVDFAGDGSSYGWDVEGSVGHGPGVTEIFNQAEASFSQTIYGLAPGYYRLHVQGFYRNHGWNDVVDANDVDTLAHNVDLFAGDVATRLRSIKSDAQAYNELVGGTSETSWSIPTSMDQANNAFENELYMNTLQFQIVEGQTEITVGVRKVAGVGDDWLCFDNWSLEYVGTAAPAEDPTTAIKSMDAAGAVTSTKIYSLDGTQQGRLLKGVNIIKTTLSDGTVRVSKVLVR